MPTVVVVCPVVPEPTITGGRKRTRRLLDAIAAAGGEPHLVTADDSNPAGVAAIRARGWSIDVIPHPRPGLRARAAQHAARRPSPFLDGVARRVSELVERGAAVVHLEHTMSAYYASSAAPTVLSLHNLDSDRLRHSARARRVGSPDWARLHHQARATAHIERDVFPRAVGVLCVSAQDAERAALLGARTIVAANGVDDALFAVPPSPAGRRVLFLGDLGYEPNRRGVVRFLGEGWPAARRRAPDAELAIVGPGLDEVLAAELRRHPGVRLVGPVDDVADAFASASVVVVPIWEGGGVRIKVLEAMAAGRAIASTSFGADGTGARDGHEAVLVDDAARLGEAVGGLLVDRDRAERMGAAGRACAEPQRWERTLEPVVEAYRHWLRPSAR